MRKVRVKRRQGKASWGPAITELVVALVCLAIAGWAFLWISGVVAPPEELPGIRSPWRFTPFTAFEQWLWFIFWAVIASMVSADAARRTVETARQRRLLRQGDAVNTSSAVGAHSEGLEPLTRPLLKPGRKVRR